MSDVEPKSDYERETLDCIHHAMPWRAAQKRRWLAYHRERLKALFAELGALPPPHADDARDIARKWL